MSVFGRATFSAAGYAVARPSYPASLFKTVLSYHNARSPTGTLLDLGCGHGLISRELSPHFAKVYATDPSANMVKQTAESTKDPKIIVRQSSAEDLSWLPDNSVDMVVAGQSAHWFDYARVWPELSRVVKPGGSMAFWGYKDNVFVGHKKATEILDRFCYAEGDVVPGVEGMYNYWEPGRYIVRNLLRQIEPPPPAWQDVKRILYDAPPDLAVLPDEETAWLRKRMNLGGLEGYLRTFSSLQAWKDAHPEAKSRAEGGDGDLADIFMDTIIEAEPEWKAMGERWRDAELDVVWGTYILMARRT
ncbi:S-adenosyl-L-methionine-dependent methyltransferase [Stachybotrys elegans]|uniref:S-adenosyl-L-methionine-dependent methyltransferase n=1 Tax=Stachybotrys elegans TaxID=80388 RepID=A0A8K0WRU2_9HYPO|nr:S-adenosyl-L-methionine-dependent methyltransferase [Stachybotrys elegans]